MNRRNLLSFLFIAATLGLMIVLVFSNNELGSAWDALLTLDVGWTLVALLCIVVNVFFDALGLHYFLRKQKYPITLRMACYTSLIGFYYSNITPGASGGQPMQVYAMSKRDVPVPIGTSAISIKFLAQQLMLVVVTTALWLTNQGFVESQLGGAKWAIYIGYAINFASIPLILLVGLHRPLVQAVITFFVRLLAKLRLVKHPEQRILRISAGLDVYHASILRLAKDPWQLVWMLLLAMVSTLGLMAVPVAVYFALHMSGAQLSQMLAAAYLLFVTASYTPLPGASGAQEGGFLAFFRGFFTPGTMGVAILVWRFFTFYLFLIIGAVMSIVSSIRGGRRGAATAPEAEPTADGTEGGTPKA